MIVNQVMLLVLKKSMWSLQFGIQKYKYEIIIKLFLGILSLIRINSQIIKSESDYVFKVEVRQLQNIMHKIDVCNHVCQ